MTPKDVRLQRIEDSRRLRKERKAFIRDGGQCQATFSHRCKPGQLKFVYSTASGQVTAPCGRLEVESRVTFRQR